MASLKSKKIAISPAVVVAKPLSIVEDPSVDIDFSCKESVEDILGESPNEISIPASPFNFEMHPPMEAASPAIQITQADRIEAVVCRIHPQVRSYIENELRGRFVAVLKIS